MEQLAISVNIKKKSECHRMHPSSLVSHVSRCTLINLLLARVHVVPCLLRPTRFLPSIVSLAGGGCLWIVGTVSHVLIRAYVAQEKELCVYLYLVCCWLIYLSNRYSVPSSVFEDYCMLLRMPMNYPVWCNVTRFWRLCRLHHYY